MIWESPRSIPNKRAQHSTSKASQPCWRSHARSPETQPGEAPPALCLLTQPVREEPQRPVMTSRSTSSQGVSPPNGLHSSKSTATEKGLIPTREGPGGFPCCVVGAVVCCMVLSRVNSTALQKTGSSSHTEGMGQRQHAGRAQGEEGWSPLNSRQGIVSPGARRLIQYKRRTCSVGSGGGLTVWACLLCLQTGTRRCALGSGLPVWRLCITGRTGQGGECHWLEDLIPSGEPRTPLCRNGDVKAVVVGAFLGTFE